MTVGLQEILLTIAILDVFVFVLIFISVFQKDPVFFVIINAFIVFGYIFSAEVTYRIENKRKECVI